MFSHAMNASFIDFGHLGGCVIQRVYLHIVKRLRFSVSFAVRIIVYIHHALTVVRELATKLPNTIHWSLVSREYTDQFWRRSSLASLQILSSGFPLESASSGCNCCKPPTVHCISFNHMGHDHELLQLKLIRPHPKRQVVYNIMLFL